MAQVIGNNQVKLNNGQIVNAANGSWYDGQQYWNGSVGAPGVINNPEQVGYGQPVSSEVNQASSMAQGYSPDQIDNFLKTARAGGGAGGTPGSGGAGGTGSNPLQEVNNAITSSFQDLQKQVQDKWGQYTAGHPFNVDEVLAEKTKSASEQIDPYYNNILGDYLLGVTRKIDRGTNDTKDLLSELNASTDTYTQNSKNALASAVEQAQTGFANNGLFGSGQDLQTEGAATQGSQSDLSQYTRKAGLQGKQLNLGLSRNIEDINAGTKDYVTNLEQNRFTDTSSRASALTKEAGQNYIQGFQSTLPTQLQASSGFDMLKSLGIYS